MSVYHLCACVLTGQRRALDSLKLHNHVSAGVRIQVLWKKSVLSTVVPISPAPLYLRSSISKSVSVPCCLLIILGETQICIMIMTRSFFLVKTYGSGLEMTPGVKAYCSWRTPVQFQEDLPPLASADTCTHMHIMKNNILRKFVFEYY